MAIARQTDPTGSHLAAQSIKKVRGSVINLVARYVRQHCQGESQKMTSEEIAERVSQVDLKPDGNPFCRVDTYRKRVAEAAAKDLILASPEQKICSITGKMATAYFVRGIA